MSLSPQAASGFGEAFSLLARQLDCKTEVLVLGHRRAAVVFDEAARVTYAIESNSEQLRTLVSLASSLAQAGPAHSDQATALLDKTDQLAQKVEGEARIGLALSLIEAGFLDRARVVVNSFSLQDESRSPSTGVRWKFWWKMVALHELTLALAQKGDLRTADEYVQRIPESFWRSRAQSDLVLVLAQAGHFDRAERLARSVEQDGLCAEALSNLAASLAEAEDSRANVVLEEALRMAYLVEDTIERVRALGSVAAALAETGNRHLARRLFRQARLATRSLQGDERTEAQRALALALIRVDSFARAWYSIGRIVIRSIRDQLRGRLVPWGADDAMRDVAIAMADAGCFLDARLLALVIGRSNPEWDRTMVALSRALAKAGRVGGAYRVARQLAMLGETEKWASAISELAQTYADAGYVEHAEKIARTIEDYLKWRVRALGAVVVALRRKGASRAATLLNEARDVAVNMSNHEDRASTLTILGTTILQGGENQVGREILSEAVSFAKSISSAGNRSEVLGDIAVALAETDHFEDAEDVIRDIHDSAVRRKVLEQLALALAQAEKISTAFTMLDARGLNTFLQTLGNWGAAFDQIESGLSALVLREATRIAGWAHSGWQKTYCTLRNAQLE